MSLFESASLVVTPNGIKESKLYSVKPTDGSGDLTVTRATTATRVNAAGLVEASVTNLLLRSEEFNNASWSNINAIITANATTAPNGTLTAEKLIANTTLDQHRIDQTPSSSAVSQTFSIYAKAGEYTAIGLRIGTTSVGFNLTTGVKFSQSAGVIGYIENVGNGWWRCSIVKEVGVANEPCRINISDGTTTATNFAGDGTSGIFIWGAQLEASSSANRYIPTTSSIRTNFAGITKDGATLLNVPRLDYTNSTCPSILIEPQRTNLVTYSDYFQTVGWTRGSGVTYTENQISPQNINNALLSEGLTTTSFNNIGAITSKSGISVIGGRTYTFSVYAKLKTSSANLFRMRIKSNLSNTNFYKEEALTTTSWKRIFITAVIPVGDTTIDLAIGTFSGTLNVYLWGAQLEEGANATSYIPTTTATVTRNLDSISKTGISSLIGQTEGTIFLDLNIKNLNFIRSFISVQDASYATNAFRIESNAFNQFRLQIRSLSAVIVDHTLSQTFTTGKYKLAFSYNTQTNGVAFYVNGSLLFQTTASSIPNLCNSIYIGSRNLGGLDLIANDSINAVLLWKTRLTNAELATLTTL